MQGKSYETIKGGAGQGRPENFGNQVLVNLYLQQSASWENPSRISSSVLHLVKLMAGLTTPEMCSLDWPNLC